MKREIFRIVYGYVVEDHSYLKIVAKEARREGADPLIRGAFQDVLNTFNTVNAIQIQGIRESTRFKFYQKLGVKFILDKKRVLLADRPGLGKTIQVLGAAVNAFNGTGANKILIVAPKVAAIDVWQRQIATHLKGEQKVFVVKKRSDIDDKKKEAKLNEARFIVVNYEMLQGKGGELLREKLKAQGIDFIIVDEAHRIRNNTQVTEAVLEFDAPYKVLLTASAQQGRTIGKIFNLLHWLYPERYEDRKTFLRQFNSDEGFRRLKIQMQNFMLRRYTEDVLIDMPPVSIEYRPLQLTGEQARLYRIFEQNLMERFKVNETINFNNLIRMAVDTALIKRVFFTDLQTGEKQELIPGVTPVIIKEKQYRIFVDNGYDAVFIRDESNEVNEHIQLHGKQGVVQIEGRMFDIELRERASHSAKYQELDTIVNRVVIQEQEKLVIFSGIVKSVNDLKNRYARQGIKIMEIIGNTSPLERSRILKEFQSSAEPMILVCTYQTLGESVDLTNAHYGVMLDSPWQDRDQIIGRLHRIGQEHEVKFYILQAKNTIDDHIEQVNWEADMIQKIVLDDNGSLYQKRDELAKLYLSANAHRQEEQLMLDKFKERIRFAVNPDHNPNKVESNVTEERSAGLFLRFDGSVLTARLSTRKPGFVNLREVQDLFKSADMLDADSQILIKKLLIRRLNEDNREGVPVKKKLLWAFLKELLPGFEDIDYDGHLEFIVELGSYIVQQLMDDPDIAKEDIIGSGEDISERLFEETMYYLDSTNILKLFSLMKVIPQRYYYDGRLLRYDPPIRIYYLNGGIRYYDGKIVEKIAPGWQIPDAEIFEGKTGYFRDAEMVRPLDVIEEKRLANQVRLGNKAAEDALVGSHLRDIIGISKGAVKRVERTFSGRINGSIDEKRLFEEGSDALLSLVRIYAINEIYDNTTLKEYLAPRLGPRIFSRAFGIAKEIMDLNADTPVFHDSNVSLIDMQSQESTTQKYLEDNEAVAMFMKLLEIKGFSVDEAVLLRMLTFEGYEEHELAQEWARMKSRSQQDDDLDHIHGLVKKFQLEIESLGRKGVLSMLGQDAAMKGGIDFNPDRIDLKVHADGQRINFVIDPAQLERLKNTAGLVPVIMDISPLKDLNLFLGLETVASNKMLS
ncbi:MAG: SNF2-related protein [Candidatus Omnitrophota bacterium]